MIPQCDAGRAAMFDICSPSVDGAQANSDPASPVRIDILDLMGGTTVGKVAEARLRLRAVEQVFCQLLADRQIPALLTVRADLHRGLLAQLECAAGHEAQVRQLLADFLAPGDFSHADQLPRFFENTTI